MFGFNHGNEVVYQCSTRLTAGSSIGVGMFVVLVLPGCSVVSGS